MRNNRKGFTITELVIVIAVIAILAAVLIPTFSGIVAKAQASAAMQKVSAAYKEAFALAIADDGAIAANETATVGNYTFTFGANGESCTVALATADGFTYNFANGAWTATKS